jgi:hypothetical protein
VTNPTHHATQRQVQVILVPPLNHFQHRATQRNTVDHIQHLLLGFLHVAAVVTARTGQRHISDVTSQICNM